MRKILIGFVRVYQIATANSAPRCKYYPSCSQYTITAIGRYGVKGFAMALWRLVRCNPWSHGGIDYVDEHLDCADVRNVINLKTDREKEVVGAN